MQRIVVFIVVALLALVGLAAGALAANWPFWQRAWYWQQAGSGWPEELPGPRVTLAGAAALPPLQYRADQALTKRVAGSSTQLLLIGHASGEVRAHFAAGVTGQTAVDGRALTAGLLGPLFGTLGAGNYAAVLDAPVGATVAAWRERRRGQMTPRQLLWQLSGLQDEAFRPFNVASPRAQLASGPDFHRAVTHWSLAYPPGSHFAETPVNAQALALVASRLEGRDFYQVLQDRLWSRFAVGAAVGLLDHRRGNMSAHCCMSAAAEDWLRLGLLLANDGVVNGVQVLPAGYVAEMARGSPVHPGYGLGYWVDEPVVGRALLSLRATGRRLIIAPGTGWALLWVGEGAAPVGLAEQLLYATQLHTDRAAAE